MAKDDENGKKMANLRSAVRKQHIGWLNIP